jgi:hypothetical protein
MIAYLLILILLSFLVITGCKTLEEEVPKPLDSTVTVRELPAGPFVLLRLPGGRRAALEAAALQRLKDWMKAEALIVLSPPVFAYFDPPWTHGFLRRNEVMLRTEAGKP